VVNVVNVLGKSSGLNVVHVWLLEVVVFLFLLCELKAHEPYLGCILDDRF
jgi:hypothetical protein